VLNKLADLMEADPLLAELESINGGKGVRIAREADLADSVACLRYYAGLADKPNGELLVHSWFTQQVFVQRQTNGETLMSGFAGQTIGAFGKEKFIYTVQDPIGVCGQM